MMYRQFAIVTLLFSLLFTACTPVPQSTNPAESAAPTAEVEAEPTTVTEEATKEATEEAIEEVTEAEVTASETVTNSEEAEAIAGCLAPMADQQLISSPAAGYCFLIPANFARAEFGDAEGFSLGIYGPETTEGHRERGFVDVTEVSTQTLEADVQVVVNDVLASLPGFTPTQTSLTLGGLPAIQLDNLPGQEINRKVFAHYENRLYVLTFVPFDSGRPDAEAEMEQLYALVMESFRFIAATDMASSYAAFLTWEGEIDGACYTLTIEQNGEAVVGVCGDAPSSTATLDAANVEWAAIQQQFGNIDAETPAGKITFQGQGSAEGDLWAQALATWASFTAMETNAGTTSASARTTLAWQITDSAEHSGQCSHLVVLAYGYAYANLIPCEGTGQSTQVAASWLTDTELDTFFDRVANGACVEGEGGYLDARGSTPVTAEEISTWAKAIYARMIQ